MGRRRPAAHKRYELAVAVAARGVGRETELFEHPESGQAYGADGRLGRVGGSEFVLLPRSGSRRRTPDAGYTRSTTPRCHFGGGGQRVGCRGEAARQLSEHADVLSTLSRETCRPFTLCGTGSEVDALRHRPGRALVLQL